MLLPQPALDALHRHRAEAVGALAILCLADALRALARLVRALCAYFLRPGVDPRAYTGPGGWAVVTGSTDGMGKALAAELAQKGINLVLVSRSQPRLDECAAELRAAHGVQTRTVAVDLCRAEAGDYARIAAALEGIEVGILVNNAGLGPQGGVPEWLEEQPAQFLADITRINALVPTLLCKLVLPGMRARRRGLVVNVGSIIANFPAPLVAAYSASKAYLNSLTRALDAECAPCGVRVQNLWAGSVATKMPGIKTTSLAVPSAAAWASAAMRQLGRETSCTPYWVHAAQDWAMRATPPATLTRGVRQAMVAKRDEAKSGAFVVGQAKGGKAAAAQ